ncbi:MAG: acetylglutamate kinase [Proteobacteria bacterium]|nr:MAG: acetylglutamate kinase [Pseudomonadota bacterium]
MRQTRALISQLLQNIGGKKEVEAYLTQFAEVDSTKFAVIKVGGRVIQEGLEDLCSALAFLYEVGLYPIVIHGAGPQLTTALAQAGHLTHWDEATGLRLTDAETLSIAAKLFTRVNHKLVDALEQMGTRARPIPTGVFDGELLEPDRLGYVGRITGLDLDPIRSAIRSGHLPILSSLGHSADGQLLNINADDATRVLAERIEPHKVIFLIMKGGVLDGRKRLIPSINLAEDHEAVMAAPWLTGGMRFKMELIKDLLDKLPLSSSVAVTAPSLLPKELFTYRGSGTLIRRGERVLRVDDGLEGIDRGRLKALLEGCFRRELVPGYFEDKRFYRIYVTESYRATAILTREKGLPYLDKFAVTERAQGEGLGGSLWDRVQRDNPRMFWRSRVDNSRINPWYFSRSEGSVRDHQWVVFWHGLDSFDAIRDAIDCALEMPHSLLSHAVTEPH